MLVYRNTATNMTTAKQRTKPKRLPKKLHIHVLVKIKVILKA